MSPDEKELQLIAVKSARFFKHVMLSLSYSLISLPGSSVKN